MQKMDRKLQKMDRKARKVLTKSKELLPKSDTARFYAPRKRGGRGLICCENCVRAEEYSICWYAKNSNEEILREVDEKQIMQNDEIKSKTVIRRIERKLLKTTGEVKKCMSNLPESGKEWIGIRHCNGWQKRFKRMYRGIYLQCLGASFENELC